MPHVILDYSRGIERDVDMGEFCDALRIAALETGIFPPAGIRVRAHACDTYVIANGKLDADFIDISIRLRGGRTLEVRKAATAHIFAAAVAQLEPVFAARPIALSFEMRDIDPDLSPRRSSIRDFLKEGT